MLPRSFRYHRDSSAYTDLWNVYAVLVHSVRVVTPACMVMALDITLVRPRLWQHDTMFGHMQSPAFRHAVCVPSLLLLCTTLPSCVAVPPEGTSLAWLSSHAVVWAVRDWRQPSLDHGENSLRRWRCTVLSLGNWVGEGEEQVYVVNGMVIYHSGYCLLCFKAT